MCVDLKSSYSTLSGETRLEDNDSDAFIEFQIEPNGRLHVIGQIGGTHEDHFVKFKFQTDQTCIPVFVEDFKSLLEKYNDNRTN
jgi:hypothetical protein